MNIAVFASHGGSDLQAIIDACKTGHLNAKVRVVISNNIDALALKRAKEENIPAFHFSQQVISDSEVLEKAMLNVLIEHEIHIIFLAGYLKILGSSIIKTFEGRIFNIHPSLLPKYGGKGMYGLHVHTAVLNAHETETGITIHRVNDEYDSGEIVAQKTVPVFYGDTPETLAERVLEQEHVFIVEILTDITNKNIRLGLDSDCRGDNVADNPINVP